MKISTQLQKTQTSVLGQGAQLFGQTRDAGARFVSTTREAGQQFIDEAQDAGTTFFGETRAAGAAFAGTFRAEAGAWKSLFDNEVAKPVRLRAELAQNRANSLVVKTQRKSVEELILRSTRDLLTQAGVAVEGRLKALEGRSRPATKRSKQPSKSKGSVAKTGVKKPLRNYDELSARDVVARVHRLSGTQVNAILRYEKAQKKRATVIRAAQQRIAAAS